MIFYDWPTILVPNAEKPWIDARTRSGGETVNGREQAVSSALGRWRFDLTVPLNTSAKIRAMRSLLARLDGRANAVRVGPCDCRNGNQLIPLIGGIPYAPTGAFHLPTGAGFSIGGVAPTVVAAAAAGALQVHIDVASTQLPLLDGAFIGLGGYFYVIVGITDLPGEEALLDIRPKLRTALSDGDPVEWCKSRAPFRQVDDDTGWFEVQLARHGTATLSLVEVY